MSYVKEYDWMASELGLKSGIRSFYALIYGFTQAGKECFFSYKGFMEKLKIRSRTTISNYIQFLTEKKLITVERYSGESNHYKANMDTLKELRAAKTANHFQEGVHFLCEGSPFHVQYSNSYNFFYDDDSISLLLESENCNEKEDTMDFIREKEKVAKQINASSLQQKFDVALIENIVRWIAEINLTEDGYIRVNRQNVDVVSAKIAYKKLDLERIVYTLSVIAKHSTNISCEKSYYLAALYNAANAELPKKEKKTKCFFSKKKEAEQPKIDVKKKLCQSGVYSLAEDFFRREREFDKYDEYLLDEIRALLSWAWTTRKKNLSVNSSRMATEQVRQQLEKLRKWHILYVMDSIRNTNKEPKNRRAYLLTALYNAPITYMTADFSVDKAYPLIANNGNEENDVKETYDENEYTQPDYLWTDCPQVEKAEVMEEEEVEINVTTPEDTITKICSKVFSYVFQHGKTLAVTILEECGITEEMLHMAVTSGFIDLDSGYVTLHKERTFAV